MRPTVSVIVAAYNIAAYVGKAIDSAIAQTEGSFELLVIDDGSSDGTVDVVKSYRDSRLRLVVNEWNLGASRARNRIIAEAQGTWLAILDGDDWWAPDRLAKLLDAASATHADLVADNWYLIEDDASRAWSTWLNSEARRVVTAPTVVGAADFVRFELGGSKPMMRRDFLERHGLWFDPALRYAHDFALFLQCIRRGARFVLIPDAYYYYRSRPGALTGQKIAQFEEILTILDGLSDELDVLQDRKLAGALDQHRRDILKWIAYYRVAGPLKDGEWWQGLNALARDPSMAAVLLKRVPDVLRARLSRWT